MADVFISYKREDRNTASLIADKLSHEGFSVWWDDQITPREAWDATIEREIDAATSVVVLWSRRSIRSEWVRIEAHFGHQRQKLVPAKIEDCEPPLAFRLTQTIDLRGWQGLSDDRSWRKLLTWLADLRSTKQASDRRGVEANPFHNVVDEFPSGEAVVDGVFINEATPAGTLFRDAPGLPVLRVLPRGHFLMGGIQGDPERTSVELPQRTISIDYPLAMSVFPITSEEFDRALPRPPEPASKSQPRSWFFRKAPEATAVVRRSASDCPVNDVSWLDAQAFCRAISERSDCRYRLPSEAEWEYACRGHSPARYSWGDAIASSQALFGLPPGSGPVPGGRFPSNAFGLHDMHGNVREWTEDLWHESYDALPLDGRPAVGGHGSMRVTRGGGWPDPPAMLRSSARARATESIRSDAIGFRVVRELAGSNWDG